MSAAADCDVVASSTCWSRADSASSFWTTVNCAVSERNWVASAGFAGSWYFSWATSSFRKVSWSIEVLVVALVEDVPVAVGVVAGGVVVVPTLVMALLTVDGGDQIRTSRPRETSVTSGLASED